MLVAFQDGDGPWVAITGIDGIYHATASSQRYSVAVGCVSNSEPRVRLYYQSVSDATEVLAECPRLVETVRVPVELQGVQSGETAEVWIGRAPGLSRDGSPIEINADPGMSDLFARTYIRGNNFGTDDVKAYRGPTLNVQEGLSVQIDMATLARPVESRPLMLVGLDLARFTSARVRVDSRYFTPNSHRQWPLHETGFVDPVLTPLDTYVTPDVEMRQPGDLSALSVRAIGSTADGLLYDRIVTSVFKDPVPQTVELPEFVTPIAPIVNSETPAPRVTVTLPIVPSRLGIINYEAVLTTLVSSTELGSFVAHAWSLSVKPGWAAGQSSVTITTPDLSNLPGWQAEMELHQGVPLGWRIGWIDRNMPAETPTVDGRQIVSSEVSQPL